MTYALRENLHFSDLGQHIIFLDVSSGRYFTIPSTWNRAFRTIVREENGSINLREVQRLRDARLIEPSEKAAEESLRAVPIMPIRSLLDERPQRASSYLTARVAWSQWQACRDLRHHGMHCLAKEVAASPVKACEPLRAGEIANRLGWAFAQSAFIMTGADQCLVRSLALARLLRRRNIAASLVLGVTASPFSAHAWVQRGDLLLNDRVERIRTFSPIVSL